MCVLQPADLCAERTSCEGEGLGRARAGVPATFKILACDRFGNRQTAGGDDVRVQVSTAAGDRQASVPGTVMDMGRGVYKVRCMQATCFCLAPPHCIAPLSFHCVLKACRCSALYSLHFDVCLWHGPYL